jgi:biopolymer transport protein ExbD
MMKLLKDILNRSVALLLAFALGVTASLLWVYHLPDEQLFSDRYDLAKVKEDVLVWWYKPSDFKVSVPPKYEIPNNVTCVLPNPLTLVVSVDENAHLSLNGEDMGTLEDTSRLKRELDGIFQQRLENRAYRVGMESRPNLPESERIEKTVYVKANRSIAYGEVVKLIDEMKGAGASPIGLQIDDSLFNPFYKVPSVRSARQLTQD